VALIDPAFVQQELATQIQSNLGAYPIVEPTGLVDVNVNSISLAFNDGGGFTVSVAASTSLTGSFTASQNIALYIDPNNPQAGIKLLQEGPVSIDSWAADLLQILIPFIGTVVIDYVNQAANQAIAGAFASIGPVGGQFLAQTLFGMTASVYGISNTSSYIMLSGTISAQPSPYELSILGKNPKIPFFLNNTRTWVFHQLPCTWGNQVSGKWGVWEEADLTALQAYASAPQPWDACYLCLPKYHKLRPGQITSFFKIPNQTGPVTGSYTISGTLAKIDEPGEQGETTFNQTYQIDLTAPDAFGNVIVQNLTSQLAAGNWQIVVTSSLNSNWSVQVNGFLDAWNPLALYLTLDSQTTGANQTPPYDPAVPSGIIGQ
jgi:hypothetical protein